MFYFNVTWMKKGSSTVFSQTVNETNMTLYLEGDGLYNVCVTAIPTTNDTMKSEEQCEIFSQGNNNMCILYIIALYEIASVFKT